MRSIEADDSDGVPDADAYIYNDPGAGLSLTTNQDWVENRGIEYYGFDFWAVDLDELERIEVNDA